MPPIESPAPPAPIALHPPHALAVDIYEAARMLGVHANTIRREIDRGRLRAVKIGRVWRVRVAELHSYLKRNEEIREPDPEALDADADDAR